MLSGIGSCAFESSPACRHYDVTSSASSDVITRGLLLGESPSSSTVLGPDVSWWTSDASTLPVNPVRRLASENSHHPPTSCCMWSETSKNSGADDGVKTDWTVDSWTSNIDDLLPTSETYKWMTVRRSRTKAGQFELLKFQTVRFRNPFIPYCLNHYV